MGNLSVNDVWVTQLLLETAWKCARVAARNEAFKEIDKLITECADTAHGRAQAVILKRLRERIRGESQ